MDDRSPLFTEIVDAQILIVDDQESNVEVLVQLLERSGYQNVVTTTDSAAAVPICEKSVPDLVLLDLQMPSPNGFEIMEMLEPSIYGPERLPILVLTADATPETKRRALASGAQDFLTKPFDPVEVELRVKNLLVTRRLQLELRDQNVILEQRVRERTRDLEQARLETMQRLALAGEYRDDTTHEHAQRVGRTAGLLAQALGIPADEVEAISHAASLHDIGKLGIADAILLKPGPLSAEEFTMMKTHAPIGAEILSRSQAKVLQVAEEIALSHHERWDGGGYPDGLHGDQIPLTGRLTAVADIFDALTHRRPYKEAWPVADAVAEIRAAKGKQLDPAIVEAFETLDHERLLDPVEDLGSALHQEHQPA